MRYSRPHTNFLLCADRGHTHTHTQIHTNTHTHTYTHAHTQAHTHIHTHTHILLCADRGDPAVDGVQHEVLLAKDVYLCIRLRLTLQVNSY